MRHVRLDLRMKLLLALGLFVSTMLSGQLSALAALAALSVFMLPFCGIPHTSLWKKLRFVFGICAVIFCVRCLLNRSGDLLFAPGGLVLVTKPGFSAAAVSGLRILIVLLCVVVVTSGKSRDYLLVITQCGVPYEMAFTTLAVLQFLPALYRQKREALRAAQLRGLKIKSTGPIRKTCAYIGTIRPALRGAIRRAEQVSIAMEARAFRAYPNRTYMRSLRAGAFDWVFAAFFCAAITAIFVFLP